MPIDGLMEAETTSFSDARGRFTRLFCRRDLEAACGNRPIVQINYSITRAKGAIRGLHFQHPPSADAKWVRCLRGRVFDVAVDLRAGSPTFLRWHAVELDDATQNAVFIPEGFAHGFQVLEENSELLYLHSAYYSPELEGGLRYDDPRLGICWPLPVSDISDRDRIHPLLDGSFRGLTV